MKGHCITKFLSPHTQHHLASPYRDKPLMIYLSGHSLCQDYPFDLRQIANGPLTDKPEYIVGTKNHCLQGGGGAEGHLTFTPFKANKWPMNH